MSKKHFIQLADYIRDFNIRNPETPFNEQHIGCLAAFCFDMNPNFMLGRWRDYIDGKCGPNGGPVKPGKENA